MATVYSPIQIQFHIVDFEKKIPSCCLKVDLKIQEYGENINIILPELWFKQTDWEQFVTLLNQPLEKYITDMSNIFHIQLTENQSRENPFNLTIVYKNKNVACASTHLSFTKPINYDELSHVSKTLQSLLSDIDEYGM